MFWNVALFSLLGLCGFIFVVAGLIMLKFPPKEINNFYGYRTVRSKASKEAWDFSQKYSAKTLIKIGIACTVGFVIASFFDLDTTESMIVGMLILFGSISYLFVKVEQSIKKKDQTNP